MVPVPKILLQDLCVSVLKAHAAFVRWWIGGNNVLASILSVMCKIDRLSLLMNAWNTKTKEKTCERKINCVPCLSSLLLLLVIILCNWFSSEYSNDCLIFIYSVIKKNLARWPLGTKRSATGLQGQLPRSAFGPSVVYLQKLCCFTSGVQWRSALRSADQPILWFLTQELLSKAVRLLGRWPCNPEGLLLRFV